MGNKVDIQGVDAEATDSLENEISELLDLSQDVEKAEVNEVDETTSSESKGEAPTGDDVLVEDKEEVANTGEIEDLTPLSVPTDEISNLKAQIEALKGVVSQLSSSKESEKKSPELSMDLDSLIEKVDFDEIMESRDKFMEFFKSAFQIAAQSTSGFVQSVVPDVVTRQVTMQEVRESFYRENSDLNAVRPYVATIASNVAAANPEWGVAEVLTEAAKVARESLGITKITPKAEAREKPPVLPGSKGVRTPAPQKSKLQSEIDELLED